MALEENFELLKSMARFCAIDLFGLHSGQYLASSQKGSKAEVGINGYPSNNLDSATPPQYKCLHKRFKALRKSYQIINGR